MKENVFKIPINASLFNYNVFTLNNEFINGSGLSNKGIFEFEGKKYDITITGKGSLGLDSEFVETFKTYQCRFKDDCLEKLSSEFTTSYAFCYNPDYIIPDEKEEFLLAEFDIKDNIPYIKVFSKSVISNEYTALLKNLMQKNGRNHKKKQYINNEYIHESEIIPIEELFKHKESKNCVYTLIDYKNKLIYIGKAKSLYRRLNFHIQTSKNEEKSINKFGCKFKITHFRYNELSDDMDSNSLFGLEMRQIREIAKLIPNRSQDSQRMNPLITDTKWILVNNQYRYHN